METTKEEMMQFLRELQDLQQWLSTNSLYEISLITEAKYGDLKGFEIIRIF